MRVAIVDSSAIDRRITERLVERAPQLTLAWAGEGLPPDEVARDLDALILDPSGPSALDASILQGAAQMPPEVDIVLFTRFAAAAMTWCAERGADRRTCVVDKNARGNSQVTAFESVILPWLTADAASSTPRFESLPGTAPSTVSTPFADRRAREDARKLLVIGASTGGPAAIGDLLRALPEDLDAAICITQHMPDGFTRRFAERLDTTTSFDVSEAHEGALAEPGRVLIAPSGRHFELAYSGLNVVARLTDAPPENWCRPAVDRLFRSAALLQGAQIWATVLTGMGRDGEAGAAALRDAGARVFAQDEASSVVWGMPGAIARAGFADAIEDVPALAARLEREIGLVKREKRRRSS